MKTNIKNIEKTVEKTVEKKTEVAKVSLVPESEYNKRYNLSGNPLLKNDISERLYSNEKVNGTTLIILAALSANKSIKQKVANIAEYSEGIKNLLADNFKNENWIRLEKLYKSGNNRSKSPAAKINPVLRALRTEGNKGYIKGFNIEKIGDINIRKAFGFSF